MIIMQSRETTETEMQEWRNWQTRRLQVPVVARSCGFKSHLLHSFFALNPKYTVKRWFYGFFVSYEETPLEFNSIK